MLIDNLNDSTVLFLLPISTQSTENYVEIGKKKKDDPPPSLG